MLFFRDVYVENMRRFVMKGSQFEPLRVQSASVTGSQRRPRSRRRPMTAFAGGCGNRSKTGQKLLSDEEPSDKENKENDQGTGYLKWYKCIYNCIESLLSWLRFLF